MKALSKVFLLSTLVLFSCQPEPEVSQDPTKVLNDLVSPYGFIGFQNAMDRGEAGTHTGVLVGGRPDALAYVAAADSCFPQNDMLPRYEDRANIQKTYNYSFQGNLGFLTLGLPLISAGLGLEKSMTVEVELNGLVIEYIDSIDVTDWYREDMRSTCRDYLQEVGFLIQTIHTDSMRISVKRLGGTNIGLSSENVGDYFQFESGVNWQIVDNFTIEVTTPHTLGYQIALMKPEDNGQALYRAMSTKDDAFVFEKIGFSDFFNQESADLGLPAIEKSRQIFLD